MDRNMLHARCIVQHRRLSHDRRKPGVRDIQVFCNHNDLRLFVQDIVISLDQSPCAHITQLLFLQSPLIGRARLLCGPTCGQTLTGANGYVVQPKCRGGRWEYLFLHPFMGTWRSVCLHTNKRHILKDRGALNCALERSTISTSNMFRAY